MFITLWVKIVGHSLIAIISFAMTLQVLTIDSEQHDIS
jgi:hypothetical protein